MHHILQGRNEEPLSTPCTASYPPVKLLIVIIQLHSEGKYQTSMIHSNIVSATLNEFPLDLKLRIIFVEAHLLDYARVPNLCGFPTIFNICLPMTKTTNNCISASAAPKDKHDKEDSSQPCDCVTCMALCTFCHFNSDTTQYCALHWKLNRKAK